MNVRVKSYLSTLGVNAVDELSNKQVMNFFFEECKNTELMLYAENAIEEFDYEKVLLSMRKAMNEDLNFYCGYIVNESCNGEYKPKRCGWVLEP